MKKILFFASALAVISMTSCKKEYTCDCHYDDDATGTEVEVEAFTDKKLKEDDAKEECETAEAGFAAISDHAHCDLISK